MSEQRIPDEARARGGASIERAWRSLQDWSDTLPPSFSGRNVRRRSGPNETHFSGLRDRPRPLPRFRVGVASGAFAVVGKGWVNGEMPVIRDTRKREILYLDGRTLDAVETGRKPYLEIAGDGDGLGPGEDGLSYLCARMLVDPATGVPGKREIGPEFLEVVHRPMLPEGFFAGGMPEEAEPVERNGVAYSSGVWPLAILRWNVSSGRVTGFDQYTVHNLQHRYTAPEPGGDRARHWFFGAT